MSLLNTRATRRTFTIVAALSITATGLLALPASAHCDGGMIVTGAYARTSGSLAKSGAVYMLVENHTCKADKIIGASTGAAKVAMLHTNKVDANGIASMIAIKGGVPVPADGKAVFERGHDHVMLMGLTRPLNDGDTLSLTLTFEHADPVTVDVPVDDRR